MQRGKHSRVNGFMLKGRLSKAAATALAVALVLCCVVGGTVAWLVAKSEPVVNTFTFGNIDIDVVETPTDDDDDNDKTNSYKIMPGAVINNKDPKVIVKKGSEACWLFVKIEESEGFTDLMTYEVMTAANEWNVLVDSNNQVVKGVYWREIKTAATEDLSFPVIKNNTVTVKDTVTQQMINDLEKEPTLTVVSYAVQHDLIESSAAAWDIVQAELNSASTTDN